MNIKLRLSLTLSICPHLKSVTVVPSLRQLYHQSLYGSFPQLLLEPQLPATHIPAATSQTVKLKPRKGCVAPILCLLLSCN